VVIARVLQDFPMLLVQVIPFSIIMVSESQLQKDGPNILQYFLTGLDVDASKFFIYFLFIYVTTFCITCLYRMFAALSPGIDDAVRFSGIALNLLM
jgi:ATP-binding cassette subfamily G (WHITE) protein 2 (SNQ2)